MRNRFYHILFVFVIAIGASLSASAQTIPQYTLATSIGTYDQITGTAIHNPAVTYDDTQFQITMPFSFQFVGGYSSSVVSVNSNGTICFNAAYAGYVNNAAGVAPTFYMIWPAWDDLYHIANQSTIEWTTLGSAPNRTVVFQWKNMSHCCGNNDNANFQIRLYESSRSVEIIYGSMGNGTAASTATVGMCAPGFGYVCCTFTPPTGIPVSGSFTTPANNVVLSAANTSIGLSLRWNLFQQIVSSFPDALDPRRILVTGALYDGTTYPKPSVTFDRPLDGVTSLTYRIVGPLPSTAIVYEAVNPANPASTVIPFGAGSGLTSYTMLAARGPLGLGDGTLDTRTASGGTYQVQATLTIGTNVQQYDRDFVIALQRDLFCKNISAPLDRKKYPQNVPINVGATFQNIGVDTIRAFRAIAIVTNRTSNQVAYRDTIDWVGTMATSQTTSLDFDIFRSNDIADFGVTICGYLTTVIDQNTVNDCATNLFLIQYDIEASSANIARPAGTLINNRTIRPSARFINNGIADISDVYARMVIKKDGVIKYNERQFIQDIPSGTLVTISSNFSDVSFPYFTPDQSGDYSVCVYFDPRIDSVRSNDTVCSTFSVGPNLSGTYTIGNLNAGNARNFPTIDSALSALYFRGVSGPTVLELTDGSYTVGNVNVGRPALDFRARIIGVNATNTITLQPSLFRSLQKNSITIRLQSGLGIDGGTGIIFGQTLNPTNSYAPVYDFKFIADANSAGYITIDGGESKSIRLALESSNPRRAVVYLSAGTKNISIKNCLINNWASGDLSYAHSIPQVRFNAAFNQFSYESDIRTGNVTYSAGVVQRDTLPLNNLAGLDTIINSNNLIEGNEISNFGYGVVTLGLGPQIKQNLATAFQRYYNLRNTISKNVISNVRRAGIYAGFEEDLTIKGNKIYNVGLMTGAGGNDAAGIMLGGDGRYNNIRSTLTRNEVSLVTSNVNAWGIKVEQVRNDFTAPSGGSVNFPDVAERTMISNNIVWGIRRSGTSANAFGISLFTSRSTSAGLTSAQRLYSPAVATYLTREDSLFNNTIFMADDAVIGGLSLAGIQIANTTKPVIVNNAIALGSVNGSTDVANGHTSSLLWIAGLNPVNPSNLFSSNNAFWGNASAIVRMVELNSSSLVISTGSQTEYQLISQWRSATKQDLTSNYINWTTTYSLTGVPPSQNYRVISTPTFPTGSPLNNRGMFLASLNSDIDSELRGNTGQLPDIGGDEFNGTLFNNEVAVVDITAPTSYRSTSGSTSDSKYIMTKAPVGIKALVRNNGGLPQTNVQVRLRVFAETVLSNNTFQIPGAFEAFPIMDKTMFVNINSGELATVDFATDGAVGRFVPQDYAHSPSYTAPNMFSTMQFNVTPRYQISVSVGSDEDNSNNGISDEYRFFIAKSGMKIITSMNGSALNLTATTTPPSPNDLTAKLNCDTLRKSLDSLGWIRSVPKEQYDFDLFERRSWEPRAVDYTMYRSMIWSNDASALSRTERDNIRSFISTGTSREKHNLIMASQEPVRRHVGMDEFNDEAFIRTVLRARIAAPGNPFAPNYAGKRVIGTRVGGGIAENINATGVTINGVTDASPNPSLMRVYSDAITQGLAQSAYKFETRQVGATDSTMGVATCALNSSVVFLGVDWKDFSKTINRTGAERVLRASIDYIVGCGGVVIPVELSAFEAHEGKTQNGSPMVDLNWTTASEQNTAHFVVEKANITLAGQTQFTPISQVQARGTSVSVADYTSADADVSKGRSYIYRLKIVDFDGTYSHSHDVAVNIGSDGVVSFGEAVPNPSSNFVEIEVDVPDGISFNGRVVDITGKTVQEIGNIDSGNRTISIDVSRLASGEYNFVAVSKAGEHIQRTVIVHR